MHTKVTVRQSSIIKCDDGNSRCIVTKMDKDHVLVEWHQRIIDKERRYKFTVDFFEVKNDEAVAIAQSILSMAK